MSRLKNENGPWVLAGDFNLSDLSDDYQTLSTKLVDSYNRSWYGFGFGWPSNRTPSVNIPATPIVRIDYVFHSKDFQSTSAQVLDKTGSDHRPMLVKLESISK